MGTQGRPRGARVGPLPRNQFAVPSKYRVRGNKRRHLSEYATSEPMPQNRETPALRNVQPQPASGQLRLQCAILLAKKGDHVSLLPLEPSEYHGEEHL